MYSKTFATEYWKKDYVEIPLLLPKIYLKGKKIILVSEFASKYKMSFSSHPPHGTKPDILLKLKNLVIFWTEFW